MNLSIGQRIVTGFIVALLILLIFGSLSNRSVRELTEQNRLVVHTLEVLQSNERLFTRMTDDAGLARGYALTGNEELRRRFESSAPEIDLELDRLKSLTADNAEQQRRIAQVRPLIERRQVLAQETIDLRQNNVANRDAQLAEKVSGGIEVMDQIRVLKTAIEDEERRLLRVREQAAADSQQQAQSVLRYGLLISIALIFIAALVIVRSIRRPLTSLIASATRVGEGDYAHRAVEREDEIGKLASVFNEMAQQVERRQESLQAQDWLNTSLARFSAIFELQRETSLLCNAVLVELAALIGARHSVIYIPDHFGGVTTLKLKGSYAVDDPPKRLEVGQGLIGQCFRDQKMFILPDVPAGYLKIQSALGATNPVSLVLLPAMFNGETKGVLELAFLKEPSKLQIEFLTRMTERFGIVLNAVASALRTEELLVQARDMTARLQEGQDELSQRNLELRAQAEHLEQSEHRLQQQQLELKRANEELEQSNEELQQTNAEMEEKQVLLEEQKRTIEDANRQISEGKFALERKVDELAQSSKYKTEFLANMSHELRTPLNSLLILSKVLADNAEATLTKKQVERAQAIHAAGTDLLDLINDILDLSKIEAGSVTIDVDELRLDALTQYVESTFRHMAESKNLKLQVTVDPKTPPVMTTDARRLQQILKNLLANACKFTSRGTVSLTISPAATGWERAHATLDISHGVVAFAVKDTGIGIPADRQQIIFEAFQQADAGTSRKYGGTGLGLSISRELTRLLGGALTLQSEENLGSTFTLFLPLKIAAPAIERHKEANASAVSRANGASQTRASLRKQAPASDAIDDREEIQPGEHVLLVIEDDRKFAEILADFAHGKGFKVLVAHTATEGIDLARRYRPTAITLDVLLPDSDGWVVMDQLKHDAETMHIPLHIITVEEQRERSLRMGAVSFLQKPVTIEAIEHALSQSVDFAKRRFKNLLIVEDDALQRKSIVDLIGNGDVHATAVGTAAEALQALEYARFDCVVIDLGLPDMPGAKLIEEIRRRYGEASPPVVIYTGKSLTRKEETELRRISDAIIVKDSSSPERLLAETALFLHRVQSKLPESKRRLVDRTKRDDPMLSDRRVLVVDDDVRNIFAITAALESHKMQVLHAESGQAGIELLQTNASKVDAVLMDVMMPEMDGYEAIRRIRGDARFKKLPIIAVTAKAMKGDRERCLDAGASDYITKPVDMDKLRSLLRVWMYK